MGTSGTDVQPRSLEVFDDLGIVDRALEPGRRDDHLRLLVGGWLTVDERLPARPPRPGIPYPVPGQRIRSQVVGASAVGARRSGL